MTVGGEPHIALEGVRAVLDRLAIGGQGVLGGVFRSAAVGDDLNAVLPCLGHRVMVSPLRGRRAQGPRERQGRTTGADGRAGYEAWSEGDPMGVVEVRPF
jgi:hypothetical protein